MDNYVYSDSEMLLATQISYFDCDNTKGRNVGAIVNERIKQYGYIDENNNYIMNSNLSKYEQKQFEVLSCIRECINRDPSLQEKMNNWTIVDVCNDNNNTGYYGCVIDTGDGNAIIGSRGSESFNTKQKISDWIEADVGLLDSTETLQQAKAQEYMEQIYYKYGNKYDSFSLTGHSLGGNLAEHMAITAPAEMVEKINHVISFDGPGFSDEYIERYKDKINKTSNKMVRYQWSLVSSLLNPLPGVKDLYISARNDPTRTGLTSVVYRHDTRNIYLDENGSVIASTDVDLLSKLLGPISKKIENTNIIIAGLGFPNLGILGILSNDLKLLRFTVDVFNSIKKKVKSAAKNLYYNSIVADSSGEYFVDTAAIMVAQDEIKRIVDNLRKKNDDIDNARRNLQYWSELGGMYRSRIMLASSSIDSEIKKMEKLADLIPELMQKYRNADDSAESNFTKISNSV